jgi:hypothetical protein
VTREQIQALLDQYRENGSTTFLPNDALGTFTYEEMRDLQIVFTQMADEVDFHINARERALFNSVEEIIG